MHPNQKGQSLHLVRLQIVSKIKKLLKNMLAVCDIAQMVGISLSRVHYILKNILNVRKISIR